MEKKTLQLKEVTIEQACKLVREYSVPTDQTELADIGEACGRILAEDVCAGFDNPPFDRSPLDGFAVRSEDIAEASKENPAELCVVDGVFAGSVSDAFVGKGQAVRIMTGAPIPLGADCIVRQEDTEKLQDQSNLRYAKPGETVRVFKSVGHHENYCFAGEDFRKGQMALKRGRKLTFAEIGLLASLGRRTAEVYRRPRAAVIATGDEIVMPGEPLSPGKIYNSNLFLIQAGVKSCGADVTYCRQAGDSPELIAECIREAAQPADIVITTGGVSVGEKDYLPQALEMMGARIVFNRISIKPGSPTTFSVWNGTPVLSLTGTPFGAAVNFNILARPVLAESGHDSSFEVSYEYAVFRGTFRKESRKTRYIKGILRGSEVIFSENLRNTGVKSGYNCFIEVPAGTMGLSDGEKVRVVSI